MLFRGPDLHCAVPLALTGFLQHLSAKYKWRPKKSYYLSVELWHSVIWQIRRWLFQFVHKKFRWGPEVATIRSKNLISPWLYVYWLEKIEIRRCAGPPGRQYCLLLITSVLVYCCTQRCQKKLKMKKQGFFSQIRVIGGILIEGARASWATPLASPMILR